MAGTPTQYYGLPTYADTDALDLTAQYNTAMVDIDSELHQMDVRTTKRRVLILGDSWTYAPYDTSLNKMFENLGYDVYNYGEPGAHFSSENNDTTVYSQAQKAVSAVDSVDLVVMIALVNDMTLGSTETPFVTGINDCVSLLKTNYNCPIVWLPNISIDADTHTEVAGYIRSYLKKPLKYNVIVNMNLIKYMLFADGVYTDDNRKHPDTDLNFGDIVYNCLIGGDIFNSFTPASSNIVTLFISDGGIYIRANDSGSFELSGEYTDDMRFACAMQTFGSAKTYACGEAVVNVADGTSVSITGTVASAKPTSKVY